MRGKEKVLRYNKMILVKQEITDNTLQNLLMISFLARVFPISLYVTDNKDNILAAVSLMKNPRDNSNSLFI